jgi:hypothetical protein
MQKFAIRNNAEPYPHMATTLQIREGLTKQAFSYSVGRSTAEIGGFLAFREIRSMIRVWGSASIVLRCPAIALCPLHSLLLSLSLCCLWSL